jgi:succinate dehydrogenase/fumarate reductase iron-sulfur protein
MARNRIRLHVFRFNPSRDDEPRYQDYEIEKEEKMSVLSALQHIQRQVDGTLSINGYYCYRKLCTVCMLRINGKNRLSCRTLVEDEMTIEPVKQYPLIKDLVVDFSAKKAKTGRKGRAVNG